MTALRKTLLATCIAASFSPVAHAEKFFGGSSISLLYSDQYEAFGPSQRTDTVFTFENVTAHNWGGTFLFFDRNQGQGSNSGDDGIYGEFSPTLSLGWATGKDLGFGPIKDIHLAATYEYGGGTNVNNYLSGFGLKWDVPGFAYLSTNFLYANNEQTKNDLQLNVNWGLPFEVASAKFLFDGYIDWSSAESDHKSDFHFNPQFKLDVGDLVGGDAGVLYAGIEYSYWNNKYGLGDAVMDTESAVSALVKFHF